MLQGTTVPQKKRNLIESISNTSSKKIVCTVSKNLEGKIRWLCDKLPTKEWSGVLLYYSAETNDMLHIIAEDVYLMDIGSGAYTEFKTDFDVFQYQVNNGLLECYTGLIHSHNRMAAFFSGQDVFTLGDNAPDMNRFFSLIVNNEGTYKAAITRKNEVKEKVERLNTYKSFEDIEFTNKISFNRELEPEYIAEYVEIIKNEPSCSKEAIDFLSTQFNEIQERKAREEREREERFKNLKPQETWWLKKNDLPEDLTKKPTTDNQVRVTHTSLYDGNLDMFIEHMGNIFATGIVTMPVKSNINVKDWVAKKMPVYFRTRFKSPDSRAFEGYLETMMYVIETNFDVYCEEEPAQQEIIFDDYDYTDDFDIYMITYSKIYEYISSLGSNEWIDKILDNLMNTGYIVPLLEQEIEETDTQNGRTDNK